VKLDVLTALNMNITVLLNVTPCSLVDVYLPYGVTSHLKFENGRVSTTQIMESVGLSDSVVNIYQNILRHIAKGSSRRNIL
jgi:hypothetical protein